MTIVNKNTGDVQNAKVSTLNQHTVEHAQEVRICFTITGNDARNLVAMLKKESREPEDLISEMIIEGLERRGLVELSTEDGRFNRVIYYIKKIANAILSTFRWAGRKGKGLFSKSKRAQP